MAKINASTSYRMLFDCVGDIAFVSDFFGNILDANSIACARLGFDRGRLSRTTLFDFDHDQTRETLAADTGRAKREGLFISERRWIGAGGAPLPVAVTLRVIEDGPRRLLLHLGRDLSQRLWAEQVFRESEERFRRIFEDASAGLVLVGADFRFLKANDGFCRFIGYREEELVSLTFQDVTWPDDRAVGGELVQSVLAGERKSFQLEKRYLRRDGNVVWGLVSSSLLWDQAGAPMYFVTQVFDITERKRAEFELRES
jgi:PAS domain S-box-containing protein